MKAYDNPSIYPAKGNSQAEFKSLYLPAIYKGIYYRQSTVVIE